MTLSWREQKITEGLWRRRKYNRGLLEIRHPSRESRSNAFERTYPDEVEAYIRRGSIRLRWG